MPKLIPLVSIVVHRDGKSFKPPKGQEFEFTEDEVKDVMRLHNIANDHSGKAALARLLIGKNALEAQKVASEEAAADAAAESKAAATGKPTAKK